MREIFLVALKGFTPDSFIISKVYSLKGWVAKLLNPVVSNHPSHNDDRSLTSRLTNKVAIPNGTRADRKTSTPKSATKAS